MLVPLCVTFRVVGSRSDLNMRSILQSSQITALLERSFPRENVLLVARATELG